MVLSWPRLPPPFFFFKKKRKEKKKKKEELDNGRHQRLFQTYTPHYKVTPSLSPHLAYAITQWIPKVRDLCPSMFIQGT